MKKHVFYAVLISGIFTGSHLLLSEEAKTTEPLVQENGSASVTAQAPAVLPTAEQGPTSVPSQPVAPPAEEGDNLEFMSGEISAVDEAAKTVTVKLYGEAENAKSEKLLTVKIDESTDITDGEKDRDLKSLAAGTEVDVEYDPGTNKATYIFVY